jgi:tRNA 5-methylaminomethyl-2-thiouridine biosynthesis bifunctional protein
MGNVNIPKKVMVIGAGIAGASVAYALAQRQIPVTVIESKQIASGGSGNPVAVIRPEPGGAHNPITTLTTLGMQWLVQWLSHHGQAVPYELCGAIRMTRDALRHQKLAQHAALYSADWISEVTQEQASELSANQVADRGFHLPVAGWIEPIPFIQSLLNHPSIQVQIGLHVSRIEFDEKQKPRITLSDGSAQQADCVVLASAFAGSLFSSSLAIDSARGQLTILPEIAGRHLHKIICRDGYITPAIRGMHTIGATIQKDDVCIDARNTDDEENFQRLQRLLPEFCLDKNDCQSGRVAFRAVTQDRLPAVGQLAPNLYASLAHGSRGMTCAPWCGEWLVSMMMGEATPQLEQWRELLNPLRLALQ